MKALCLVVFLSCMSALSAVAQYPQPLAHGVRTSGYIYDWEYDSISGKLYAAGYFENIGGVEVSNIAVFDGTTWSPLGTGVNGTVTCLKMFNGELYVGGYFSNAGGVSVSNVAKWNGASWDSVGQLVTTYAIMDIEVYDADLYLSAYLSVSQPPAVGIVRLDSGVWTEIATTNSSGNFSIHMHTFNDTMLVYGYFNDLNGVPVQSSAAYAGGVFTDRSVPLPHIAIADLVIYNEKPYCISDYGKLMHFEGSTWVIDSAELNDESILIPYNDSLYAFTIEYGAPFASDSSVFLNVSDGFPGTRYASTPFVWQYKQTVRSHIVYDGNVLMSGLVYNFNGEGLASTISFNGSAFTQSPHTTAVVYGDPWWNASVWTMCLDSLTDDIYVGGFFTHAGDSLCKHVARWDGSHWYPLGDGFNGRVRKLVFFNDTLYAAGSFTRSGNTPVNRIARWNGTSWQPVGAGADGTVTDMAVLNNTLFVSGLFDTFNGLPASHVVRYDNGQWAQAGPNGLGDDIYGLEVYNGSVVAYSNSTITIGSFPNYIYADMVRFNGTNWVDFPATGVPSSLQTIGGNLYALITGFTASVQKYDGAAWSAADNGLVLSSWPSGKLLSMDTTLVLTVSNSGVYSYDGNMWHPMFDYVQPYDMVKPAAGNWVFGGFFPSYYYLGGDQKLYNVGEVVLSSPVAAPALDQDTICDHQYITFTSGFTMVPTVYEWMFPGGVPATSASEIPIIKYNVPGTYDISLKLTTYYGVDSVYVPGAVTVINCSLGFNDVSDTFHITGAPNPVKDMLQVLCDAPAEKYEVLDITGRVLVSTQLHVRNDRIQIDFSSFRNGCYIVRIHGEKGYGTVKVMKQ